MEKKFKGIKLNLQTFSEEPPGGEPGVNNPPGGQEPPGGNEPPKTFTQEELNAIASKEAKKAQEKLLKQLGVEDFNSAKDGLAKFKEYQDSLKTDQEKLNEQLNTYQSQLSEKDTALFDSQAENACLKAGITDDKNLKAVMTLAKNLVTDELGIGEAIQQVITDYPQFVGNGETNNPEPPPKWTTGTHSKHTPTEAEKWKMAFSQK